MARTLEPAPAGLRYRPIWAVVRTLQSGVDALATVMAHFSGILFLLVAFYTTADVVGRRFGVFSGVTDEVSGYVLVTGTMWGLAYALKRGAHVRIDVLLPLMPPRLRFLLDASALALMGLFAFVLTLYAWRMALLSWQIKAKALGLLATPLYIPQFAMAFGLSIITLEAVVMLAVLGLAMLFREPVESASALQEREE